MGNLNAKDYELVLVSLFMCIDLTQYHKTVSRDMSIIL